MMTPLPFVWPYWLPFWAVWVWVYWPEIGIVRRAQKAAKSPDSKDAGSINVILIGGSIGALIAFPVAWYSALKFPVAWQLAALVIGTLMTVAGALLRRHCFRQLGKSFTGDVRAAAGQIIVQTGAYALVRHPAYTGGILMNAGMGVALGSWASALLLTASAFLVYAYRISVEERALLAGVGQPYQEYMRTHPKRLIPFLY